MADTETNQLIIYVGTQQKIDEAKQQGLITNDDFAVVTDAPDYQEKLNQIQMNAVNSGITTQLVTLYDNHVANTIIHVTAQDKTNWNGKQNALNSSQLEAVNSGITSTGVAQITTNKNNISNEVTARENADGELQDQINNLKARGRFLALWNCATGLAQTNPPQNTYEYKAGDYFIVGTVAQGNGTNYKPSGSSYTIGVASTVVETAKVDVDDVYYYDGTTWSLQINTQKEVAFVNIAGSPYDNTNLATALNSKVPTTRTINNKALSADITLDPSDIGAATSAQGALADTAVQPATLNNYVTTNTVQRITAAKEIVGVDSGTGTQANIFCALSTQTSTQPDAWKGRMMVGAKNVTFLMGVFNGMAGLGAHSWTDSAAGSGAAWDNVYINPDGDKALYVGGYAWRKNSGWFRVQNTGSNSNGTVQVNKGTISNANWKDVAYKGENISDFNNNAGYATEQYVDDIVGDIETLLNNINSGS